MFSKNWLVHHLSVIESHPGKFLNEKNNSIFGCLQPILASKCDHQAKTRYTTQSGLSHHKQHNKKDISITVSICCLIKNLKDEESGNQFLLYSIFMSLHYTTDVGVLSEYTDCRYNTSLNQFNRLYITCKFKTF